MNRKEQIKKVLEDLKSFDERLSELRRRQEVVNDVLLGLLVEAAREFNGSEVVRPVLGKDWFCPPSDDDVDRDYALDLEPEEYWEHLKEFNPSGYCLYDDESDPCHDNCVFCGFPEERK